MGSDKEVLLTEVKIRKHKLYHYFHGLGGYFKDWNTIYSSKVLGRKGEGAAAVQALRTWLDNNPFLKGYAHYKFQKKTGPTHFDVVWLEAPPGINDIIRQKGGWSHDDPEF